MEKLIDLELQFPSRIENDAVKNSSIVYYEDRYIQNLAKALQFSNGF